MGKWEPWRDSDSSKTGHQLRAELRVCPSFPDTQVVHLSPAVCCWRGHRTLVSCRNTGLTIVEPSEGGGGARGMLCMATFSADIRIVKIFFVCTSGDHLAIF